MNFEQLKEVIVATLPNCNPDAVTPEAQLVPDVFRWNRPWLSRPT